MICNGHFHVVGRHRSEYRRRVCRIALYDRRIYVVVSAERKGPGVVRCCFGVVLIDVMDGEHVAVDLPDGVEVVRIDVVDHGFSACCVTVTCTVFLCVPALEGVALACGQLRQVIIVQDCNQTIVGNAGDGLGLARAEVAVVGQADCTGLGAEDGVEGGIGGHFDGRAGFVDHGGAFLRCIPAEEDLACGRSRCRTVHNDCVGVCVVVAVFNDIRLAVDAVGQLIAFLAADLGIQVIVFGDLGIEVERGAVP